MPIRKGSLAIATAGFIALVAHVAAQGPPPAPASAPAALQGQGGGQGRGGGRGTFPQQQRAVAEPEVVERGKTVYSGTCSACHGVDARGGQLGGPNLLRSAVVLNDKAGELITPIVRGSRAERGMPPIPMSDEDASAVVAFLHYLLANAGRQGAPPPGEADVPNALVGDASAGQAYFAAKCASCHSPTGNLKGIADKYPEAKMLQTAWVTGGGGRGGGRGVPNPRAITATVVTPAGETVQGRLVRIDDFLVTLALADQTLRSFRRDGDQPKIALNDPLAGHKALLPVLTDKDMHDVTAFLTTLK